jgi:hypothetical protein
MKKNQTILAFVISFLSLNLISQTWQKTYSDGNTNDMGYAICKTLDSCYLIGGHADYNVGMLYKIDKNGLPLWSRSYNPGINFSTFLNTVLQNPDSTIIISGDFTNPFHGATIKLSKTGNILFSLKNTGRKALKLTTGDYVTYKGEAPSGWTAISRITTSGSVLWEKKDGITANSMAQLSDGNLICVGNADYTTLGQHLALMKLNTNGDTLWTKYKSYTTGANSVYAINTGGFIFTNSSTIYKCDNNGTLLFEKNINYSVTISKVIDALDGGSYIGGSITGQGSGGSDFFLMKIDATGNTLWSKAYGSILDENLSDLIVGYNNTLILVGNTNGVSSINNDIYVVTTDMNGNTSCNQTTCTLPIVTNTTFPFQSATPSFTTQNSIVSYTITNNLNNPTTNSICSSVGLNELNKESTEITVFPNPSNNNLTIVFNSTNNTEKLEFYNINGACVLTEEIGSNFGPTKINVNTSNLPSGIYLIRLGTLNTKVVIE